VIGAAVIFSKVLSPQYFLWSIPLLMLVAIELLPEHPAWRWTLLATLVFVVTLTTWIFPYHYQRTFDNPSALVSINLAADSSPPPLATWGILAARNFLYLAIVAWLGSRALRGAGVSVRPKGNQAVTS
jgi:hypothetical protein